MWNWLKKFKPVDKLIRHFKRKDMKAYLNYRGARIHPGAFVGDGLRVIERRWAFLLEMEEGAGIGAGSTIILHDSAATVLGGIPKIKYGKVIFREFASVGAGSIVLPGVELGERCMVGAGSVVTRSIPPRTVWSGNPARFICTLDEWSNRLHDQMENPGPLDIFIEGFDRRSLQPFKEKYIAEREKKYAEQKKKEKEEKQSQASLPGPETPTGEETKPSKEEPSKADEKAADGDRAAKLKEFLATRYLYGEDPDLDEALFSGGLLDSFALIELTRFIEESFDLQVPPDDRSFETFDTVERMVAYIEEKKAS